MLSEWINLVHFTSWEKVYMMKRGSLQLTLARLCKEQIKEREKERNLLCSPVNICWSVPSAIFYICGSTHTNYVPERGMFCWETLGIKKKKNPLYTSGGSLPQFKPWPCFPITLPSVRMGIPALGWDLCAVPSGWNQNCNFQIRGDRKIPSCAKLGGKILSFKDGVMSNNREMTGWAS